MKTAEARPVAKQTSKTDKPFFSRGGSALFSHESGRQHSSFGAIQTKPFFANNRPIQTKLKVGEPNDKFEKEADHVADKVVQRLANTGTQPSTIQTVAKSKETLAKPISPVSAVTPLLQAKCSACESEEKIQKDEEEKEVDEQNVHLQRKRVLADNADPKGTEMGHPENQYVQRKCAHCEVEDNIRKQSDQVGNGGKAEAIQRKPIFESNARTEEQVQKKCADCEREEHVQKLDSGDSPQQAGASVENNLRASRGGGSALPEGTRTNMESAIGADFSGVRIHTDDNAVKLSNDLNAQAFTHGNDIYFNAGKYETNSGSGQHLLAHELTHTLQQGASIHRKPVVAVETPVSATFPTHENMLQREGENDPGVLGSIWNATGGAVVGAASDLILDQMRSLSPNLIAFIEEVRRVGVINYFKNKLMQAINGIFDGLQNNSELINSIFPQFGELVVRARVIVNALAAGDCKPLFAAMNELKDLVTTLAGEAWDAIVTFFQPAIDFFTNLWNSFALPALEWLKQKASAVWEWIKELGGKIWNWFKPLRDVVAEAWDYIKGIIGLNADETGEEGLIQWAQRKAGEVWEAIKEQLKPIIEPAKAMIAKIKEIIPLSAILNLRKTIQDWLKQVVATSTAMGDDASNVGNEAAQTSLRDQILPAIQQSIENFRGTIADAAAWVNGKIGEVFNTVTQFFATVKSISIVNVASGIIGWVEDKVNALNNWVQSKVSALFDMVSEGLHKVGEFMQPVYDTLVKILDILGNILGKLPDFLMGPLWAMLPTCIKDPIKQFFLDQILGRMSFFQKLKAIENLWDRLQAMAITILKQIFIDGNLRKAIWTFFSTMMDILGLPPTLVTKVIAKAAQSLSDLLDDPLGFLGNFIQALKLGFNQFYDKIGTYLLSGFQAWLLGKLEGTGIEVPTEFTFKSMLKLAFQVLGITVDMLLEVLEEVTGKKGLKAKIEGIIGAVSNAFEWLEKLLTKSEDGGSFWDRLESSIGSIWDFVLDAVVSWLEKTIVVKALAWVATKLDPTGIMAVITTIIDVYNVISSIIEKAKEIFEMIDKVLDGFADLIKGVLPAAATLFEKALGAAIPVVMAILSALFGLDGAVDEVKKSIEKLREKVKAGVRKVFNTIKGWVMKLLGKGGNEDADVKQKAKNQLLAKIGDETTLDELDAAISEVKALLEKDGLKRLWKETSNEGETIIEAEASPVENLFKLVSTLTKTRPQVTCAAKIKFDKEAYLATTIEKKDYGNGVSGDVVTGGNQYNYATLGSAKYPPKYPDEEKRGTDFKYANIEGQRGRASGRVGGAVLLPPTGSDELEVITWNNGPIDPKSNICHNQSHAEKQFIKWFSAQPINWKQSVKEISIALNVSPCTFCCVDLADFIKQIPAKIKAKISWTEVYQTAGKCQELSTTGESIAKLSGWDHSGQPEPEQVRNSDKLTVESD